MLPTTMSEWLDLSVLIHMYRSFRLLSSARKVDFPDWKIAGFSSEQPVTFWSNALKFVTTLNSLPPGQHSNQSSPERKSEDLPLGLKYSTYTIYLK
jgi:hypothetical protein